MTDIFFFIAAGSVVGVLYSVLFAIAAGIGVLFFLDKLWAIIYRAAMDVLTISEKAHNLKFDAEGRGLSIQEARYKLHDNRRALLFPGKPVGIDVRKAHQIAIDLNSGQIVAIECGSDVE